MAGENAKISKSTKHGQSEIRYIVLIQGFAIGKDYNKLLFLFIGQNSAGMILFPCKQIGIIKIQNKNEER